MKKKTATEKAEARKNYKIKMAQANVEQMRLSGVGFAAQRLGMMKGLQSNLKNMLAGVRELSPNEGVSLLLLQQYFDLLLVCTPVCLRVLAWCMHVQVCTCFCGRCCRCRC